MAFSVQMPALGESVTEGTVTRWLKQVGDTVEVDEPLLEVSTDKVDTEIPSPAAGVLTKIVANEDDTVAVGGELAIIGASDSAAASATAATPEPAAEKPAERAPEPAAAPSAAVRAPEEVPQPRSETASPTAAPAKPAAEPSEAGNGPYVTPLVRKLAAEHDIDLNAVKGTGVGGRIRKQDVLAAADAKKAAAAAPQHAAAPSATAARPAAAAAAPSAEAQALRGTTQKMTRLRQTVSRRMVESLQTAAQLTQV